MLVSLRHVALQCRRGIATLPWRNGTFGSAMVTPEDLSAAAEKDGPAAFATQLSAALIFWRAEGRGSVWIRAPATRGDVIAAAAAAGFRFHHAEGDVCTMHQWLPTDRPCPVPAFATHQVGVAGLVVADDGRMLFVKEPGRIAGWKLPGGHADLGEELGETAAREVFEEVGVRSEFVSVLAFRHQHGVAWGRDDLYFICRMRALSSDITLDPREISDAAWMAPDEFLAQSQHELSRLAVKLAVAATAASRQGGQLGATSASGSGLSVTDGSAAAAALPAGLQEIIETRVGFSGKITRAYHPAGAVDFPPFAHLQPAERAAAAAAAAGASASAAGGSSSQLR